MKNGMNDQTIKADEGKLRLSLVPTQIIRDIAEVREYGISKYGEKESWRNVEPQRYIDAMYRHMLAFVDNPYGMDEESGLPHLWHLACNCAFLCELLNPIMYRRENDISRKKEISYTISDGGQVH